MSSMSLLSSHMCIVFYFFGKCIKQERLILPLNNSSSHRVYIQLVPPSLLLIPVVGSAGQSPPAEHDWMKAPFPSMVGLILQVVMPVHTVRYLSSLEEVFCRTCNQVTTFTKWIVYLCVNSTEKRINRNKFLFALRELHSYALKGAE